VPDMDLGGRHCRSSVTGPTAPSWSSGLPTAGHCGPPHCPTHPARLPDTPGQTPSGRYGGTGAERSL